MKSKLLGLLAVALLAGPMVANAALIGSTTLGGVVVAGTTYDVTFWQDDGGSITTVAQVNTLPITFTTPESAQDAATAINAALDLSPGFDFHPANNMSVFSVVFSSTSNVLNLYYCVRVESTPSCGTYYGSGGGSGSFATFASTSTVPEPGTLALLGLGLAGLGLSRRLKAD